MVVAGVVGVLLLASCGLGSRPSVAEWQPAWTAVTEAIPTQAQLGDPADKDMCATTLGVIRENAPDLSPTPDLSTDDAVSDWLSIAETTFFECPPDTGEISSLSVAYEEMDRLTSDVNNALGLTP